MFRCYGGALDGVRKIIHCDMDAFYAAIEQRDSPRLRGRPVVVGGSPRARGVVASASYEARRFGIHSAMPSSTAARLCPEAIFVRGDFERYRQVSLQLRELFAEASDQVEPLSLDEAYLDVTADRLGLGSATATAGWLRDRIRDTLGLTASAGVSHLKFVAKIASDHRKPDGLTVVPPGRVLDFVHPLPVRQLWGVGPATEQRLLELGARTIGQLARLDPARVEARLGRHGRFLWRLSRGHDPRPVRPSGPRRSHGREHTFPDDVTEAGKLEEVLADQARRVCERLRRQGLQGRTVSVKVRYADFTTVTRAHSLDRPTADPSLVARVASGLLSRTRAGDRPVRLVGVSVGSLRVPLQLELPL